MNASEVRKKYIDFFVSKNHKVIPRAQLVPQDDATTLFTGSGMQPLVPYLLGEEHPEGMRLVDSQTCLRAEDIEEVGDNRHTTFFEMLGNWSLGDYFKKEQINWFWEFLTNEIKLDPERIYVTCFIGDKKANLIKDTESADIWQSLFKKAGVSHQSVDIGSEADGYKSGVNKDERIFYYDASKNWWSRSGTPDQMPIGEPGGGDTEMFYLFPEVQHNSEYGKLCHPNCECGRYIELGNSVFMEYIKTKSGFEKLPKRNVDYGGGLERIAAATMNEPDVFKISLLWPIIEKLEQLSGKKYDSHTNAMRVIADHLRGATFLAVDGVMPSNKEQGYVMRRLMRRAIRFAFELGIEQNFCQEIVPVIADLYANDYPEVSANRQKVIEVLIREEKVFRQTLRNGVREFGKLTQKGLTGVLVFKLYDTYGFPKELSLEEASSKEVKIDKNWQNDFDNLMKEQKERSRTATRGIFKGGLAGGGDIHKKYHTATHLMYKALKMVLGEHIVQKGSNITNERLRFDFTHDAKMTVEQIKKVEDIVNEQIKNDLIVTFEELPTKVAIDKGAIGAFGDKYGDKVKVYSAGKKGHKPFSFEICGGPHVEHTGQLAEGSKAFKIIKEESSSAGVRRIKAILS